MSTYKLTYFNIRARAETTRMLFILAGQEFEDNRIKNEEWSILKKETVFGQLPMLDVDGITLCQSHAIERLVAKRFGFYGANDIEQAHADMVVDCLEDVRRPLREIKFAQEETLDTLKKKFTEEQFPMWSESLNKMINSNGYFVGNKISWPDIFCFNILEFAELLVDTSPHMAKNVKLKALTERVASEPKIAEWLAKRPPASH